VSATMVANANASRPPMFTERERISICRWSVVNPPLTDVREALTPTRWRSQEYYGAGVESP
jgi:hypothetical protein